MDIPRDYLEQLKKKASEKERRTERGDLIEEFLVRLNAERAPPLKPLSAAFLSMKLSDSGLKSNASIYQFLADCKDAKNFGAYFWWALNPKNAKNANEKNNNNRGKNRSINEERGLRQGGGSKHPA